MVSAGHQDGVSRASGIRMHYESLPLSMLHQTPTTYLPPSPIVHNMLGGVGGRWLVGLAFVGVRLIIHPDPTCHRRQHNPRSECIPCVRNALRAHTESKQILIHKNALMNYESLLIVN